MNQHVAACAHFTCRRRHWAALAAIAISLLTVTGTVRGAPVTTVSVATGLNRPVYACSPPGDTSRLFIVEKRGVIKILDLGSGTVLPTPFLDIDTLVVNPTSGQDERGLLGLAFHPNYANNGNLYVNYIDTSSAPGDTVVARYRVQGDPMTSNVANPASALILLTVDQPESNHNGGCMQFGPDGMLYIGLGDGGGFNDQHGTIGNGQNTSTLLGKLLRLNVDIPSPYVPADNPFVGAGPPLDEIWALGLRNPWRFSFDALTDDFYLADVGQNTWEEVNYIPAGSGGGQNYGWRCMEGNACFISPSGPDCVCNGQNLTYPIHVYNHSNSRCSITGGYVYRGSVIPGENGNYFYGDFCTGEIWSFRVVNGAATGNTLRLTHSALTSFGQGGDGELYVVTGTSTAGGVVRRIVPLHNNPADINADGSIDQADADLLTQALLGVDLGDPALMNRADVNGDGTHDGEDIQAWLDAM